MARRAAALGSLALVVGLAALGGCATSANQARPATEAAKPRPQPPLASAVLPGEAIVRYQDAPDGTLPFERFEFSRNDERLSVVHRGPIEGTRQWPEPPRPRERPVIFLRWRQ